MRKLFLLITLLSLLSCGSQNINVDATIGGDVVLNDSSNNDTVSNITNGDNSSSAETTPVNNAPNLEDDFGTTTVDTDITISVLDNDSDPEGDTLSITSFTQPENGVVVDLGSGVYTYTPNTSFYGVETFEYFVSDGNGNNVTATVKVHIMTPFTWIGAGADANWNNPDNWCGTITSGECTGGTVPGTSDLAVFNSSCEQHSNCDPSINVAIDIGGIEVQSDFSGTITQETGQTVSLRDAGYLQEGGSFLGSDADFAITDAHSLYQLIDGEFTAPSTNLDIRGGIVIGSPTTTPTFDHNNGTLRILVGGGPHTDEFTIHSSPWTINEFFVERHWNNHLELKGTLIVEGGYTQNNVHHEAGGINQHADGGSIEVMGDVDIQMIRNNYITSLVPVKLTGTTDQNVSGTSKSSGLGSLEIDKPSGNVTITGVLSLPHGFSNTSGSTVDTTTSTLYFGYSGLDFEVLSNGTEFYNIEFNISWNRTATLTDPLNIANSLVINNHHDNTGIIGDINVEGDVNLLEVGDHGVDGTFSLVGNQNQNLSMNTSARKLNTDLYINKSAGTVTLQSNFLFQTGSEDLYLQAGTLDLSSYTFTADHVEIGASGVMDNSANLTSNTLTNNGTMN